MQRSVAHRRFGKNTGNNFPPERSGAPDFLARKCDWRIRDKIEAVLPICQGYNARIKAPGGFHLINTARERIWKIASGKANFAVFPGIQEDEYQSNPDPLWLMTLRSHDQYNTTLYANNDRYRGVYNQRDIGFLNDKEMRKRGLTAKDRVDVRTLCSDGIERMLRGFKNSAVQHPRRLLRRLFPRSQRAGGAEQIRSALRHAKLQSRPGDHRKIPGVTPRAVRGAVALPAAFLSKCQTTAASTGG